MADLTQTAANVTLSGNSSGLQSVQGAEAITQGMPVFLDSASSRYYQTDANVSAAAAAAVGIALTPCDGADDWFVLAPTGSILDLGATLVVGTTYIVSGTKGAIAPISDAVTGWYVTHLGVASVADVITLDINVSGVAVP